MQRRRLPARISVYGVRRMASVATLTRKSEVCVGALGIRIEGGPPMQETHVSAIEKHFQLLISVSVFKYSPQDALVPLIMERTK
jgi:hypothetical protein